jgi:hypothetical protein
MWFIFITLVLLSALIIHIYKFEKGYTIIAVFMLLCIPIFLPRKENNPYKSIKIAVITASLISVFIQTFMYSELMHYNAGMNAARWINKNMSGVERIVFDCQNFPFDFYSDSGVQYKTRILPDDFIKENTVIFAPDTSIAKIDQVNFSVEVLKKFEYFRITKLKKEFINKRTRGFATSFYIVAKISRRQNR